MGESIFEAERRSILTTLAHLDGNKSQAAEVLGISVKALHNRVHQYSLMATERGTSLGGEHDGLTISRSRAIP